MALHVASAGPRFGSDQGVSGHTTGIANTMFLTRLRHGRWYHCAARRAWDAGASRLLPFAYCQSGTASTFIVSIWPRPEVLHGASLCWTFPARLLSPVFVTTRACRVGSGHGDGRAIVIVREKTLMI